MTALDGEVGAVPEEVTSMETLGGKRILPGSFQKVSSLPAA